MLFGNKLLVQISLLYFNRLLLDPKPRHFLALSTVRVVGEPPVHNYFSTHFDIVHTRCLCVRLDLAEVLPDLSNAPLLSTDHRSGYFSDSNDSLLYRSTYQPQAEQKSTSGFDIAEDLAPWIRSDASWAFHSGVVVAFRDNRRRVTEFVCIPSKFHQLKISKCVAISLKSLAITRF